MHPFKKAFRDKDVILKRFGWTGSGKFSNFFSRSKSLTIKNFSTLAEFGAKRGGPWDSGAVKAWQLSKSDFDNKSKNIAVNIYCTMLSWQWHILHRWLGGGMRCTTVPGMESTCLWICHKNYVIYLCEKWLANTSDVLLFVERSCRRISRSFRFPSLSFSSVAILHREKKKKAQIKTYFEGNGVFWLPTKMGILSLFLHLWEAKSLIASKEGDTETHSLGASCLAFGKDH